MTVDPRAALDRLTVALEAHLIAIVARRGDEDPAVDDAYYVLADAFEVYDEALAVAYSESTPFDLAEDDDDEDDEDEDEANDDNDDDDEDDEDGEDDDDLDSDDDLDGLTEDDIATLVDREHS